MTYDESILIDFKLFSEEEKEQSKVYLGNDHVVTAVGEGKVRLATSTEEGGQCLALEKVALVPDLTKNLLSVPSMTQKGVEVRFNDKSCVVVKEGKHYPIGHCVGGKLYCVGVPASIPDTACFTSGDSTSKDVWHHRFGHLNMKDVDKLIKSQMMVVGMNVTGEQSNVHDKCEGCVLEKMTRTSFPKKSMNRATKLLEIVHTDLCGPMQVPSHGGSRYVLTFTDDYSRYTTVYFLRNKSDTLFKFKEYVGLMQNHTGHKVQNLNIKTLRSDNGGEYTSNNFDKFCHENGISRQFTNPYCPEQNGVAERFNRTMIESARSMLYHAKLPLQFWAEAVSTAVYIRNRCPTASLNNKTPYECWFCVKPDVTHLRVFGSQCYVHIPNEQRKKLDAKSYKGIFVGYPNGVKGYKVFKVSTGTFHKTCSVDFSENKFHAFGDAVPPQQNDIVKFVLPDLNEDEPVDFRTENQISASIEPRMRQLAVAPPPAPPPPPPPVPPQPPMQPQPPMLPEPAMRAQTKVVGPTFEETFMNEVENIGSVRVRSAPKRFDDECNYSESLLDDVEEPKSFKGACNDEHHVQWEKAMKNEFTSLIKNKTWDLVPRPEDKNIVGNRWVYKIKRDENGSVERFKARLVAKGFTQTEGVDYGEVFSPVARFPTIRSLLAFANAHNLEIHHMDVTTAFLNGDLDCEIFMEQPEGFVDATRPDYVCRLKKGLYGLKQSARCWNATLDEFLRSRDFHPSPADECMYIKTVKQSDGSISFVILGVYVDDIIPVSNDLKLLACEKRAICDKFDMVDNGEIRFCLGLTIKRDRARKIITISQPNYIENVLIKFGMENSRPVATPLEPGVKFYKTTENDALFDVNKYQKAIGSLTYAAICTRPDISAAVSALSSFMSNPSEVHWTGVKRILRYLRGTSNYGLVYDGNNVNELVGFSDADWAGDVNTRRSTSGYVFRLGNATVTWASRKQATVAKSSTEAEYVALSMATQEVIWLRRLFASLGLSGDVPTLIFEDNQGAIDISKNPKHHDRTKHIDVSHHFVRERVASNEIAIVYCPTDEMTADVMTKGLGAVKYRKFRDGLGVFNVNTMF